MKKKTCRGKFYYLFRCVQLVVLLSLGWQLVCFPSNTYSLGHTSFFFLLVAALCGWILVLIHELGHLLFFIIRGVEVQSIHVPGVQAHIIDKKVFLSWKTLFTLKGIVIPRVIIDESRNSFIEARKKVAFGLIGGPALSAFLAGIIIIIRHSLGESISYTNSILILYLCVISFFILNNCCNREDGDIVAYYQIVRDDLFFASYWYTISFFQSDFSVLTNPSYAKETILQCLNDYDLEKIVTDRTDMLSALLYCSLSGIDSYFTNYIACYSSRICKCILEKIHENDEYQCDWLCLYLRVLLFMVIVGEQDATILEGYMRVADYVDKKKGRTEKYLQCLIRSYLFGEDMPSVIWPIQDYEYWKTYSQYEICELNIQRILEVKKEKKHRENRKY